MSLNLLLLSAWAGNFGGPDLVTGGDGELLLRLDLGGGTSGVGVTLFTMDDLYSEGPLKLDFPLTWGERCVGLVGITGLGSLLRL